MSRRLLGAIALLLAMLPAVGASAAPDDTKTLAPGESFTFNASVPAGTNINYFPWVPQAEPILPVGQCSKNMHYYCDTYLVKFTNPMTADEIASGLEFKKKNATVSVSDFTAAPVADYDLRAFASDEAAKKGAMLGESGNAAGEDEQMTLSLRSTPTVGDHWVLIEVGYWSGVGDFNGLVKF